MWTAIFSPGSHIYFRTSYHPVICGTFSFKFAFKTMVPNHFWLKEDRYCDEVGRQHHMWVSHVMREFNMPKCAIVFILKKNVSVCDQVYLGCERSEDSNQSINEFERRIGHPWITNDLHFLIKHNQKILYEFWSAWILFSLHLMRNLIRTPDKLQEQIKHEVKVYCTCTCKLRFTQLFEETEVSHDW